MYFELTKADMTHHKAICRFTDFWLAGRGRKSGAPGVVNDYFISRSQHEKYITKYQTYIVINHFEIIAWAVVQHDGSLIHLLIDGYWRGKGLGSYILKQLNPQKVHSKSNQSSGDPAAFYKHCGYKKTGTVKSRSRLDIDKLKPFSAVGITISGMILILSVFQW